MGLLLFYPTPVFEKEDAIPEDFNQRLEKWIIDYSNTNEEAKNWSKNFYGNGFTSYGSEGLASSIENGSALLVEPSQRINASHKAVIYTGSQRVQRIERDGTVVRRD